jgi:hypothetical protein
MYLLRNLEFKKNNTKQPVMATAIVLLHPMCEFSVNVYVDMRRANF